MSLARNEESSEQRVTEVISVQDAILGRRSIRSFKPQTFPLDLVEKILDLAARAPSGVNAQPWKVYVVAGEARDHVGRVVRQAAEDKQHQEEYAYAPKWWEPYLARKRKVGYDLYDAYGIERSDMKARWEAAMKNFDFHGAPVGVFFTMDKRMQYGQWLDMGIFLGNFLLAARSFGLEACAQQVWCEYGPAVHNVIGIPDDEVLVTGLSLGYADEGAPENSLHTERASASEFARFMLRQEDLGKIQPTNSQETSTEARS